MKVLNLETVKRQLATKSLNDFIRLHWPQIDPTEYVPGWHIDLICEHLEAVNRGEIRKLLINIPPRHMKSISVAVAWPAWTWAQAKGPLMGPGVRFFFASYAMPLSVRDSVKCRRLIDSAAYQSRWGERFQLTSDQNTKIRFDNDQGGYRLATSIDSVATGEGGDIIVVDDPQSLKDAQSETVRRSVLEWWTEAMPTRLTDPHVGAYVMIMQRLHEADLSGYVLEEGGWTHLCLPARFEPDHPCVYAKDPRTTPGELLWPDQFGEAEIAAMNLSTYTAAGQLQQRPAPREGGMFERGWFNIVPQAPADARRVRYWDLAATAQHAGNDPDWTAGVRISIKDGVYYIEDVRRVRDTPHHVEELIQQTAELDKDLVPAPAIWMEQEGGSSGKNTIDHYARHVLVGFPFRGSPVTGSKEARADPLSAAAEAGNVKMVKANWNTDFLSEIEVFPLGSHDDQVDAAAGALEKLSGPERLGPQIRRL